MTGRREGVVIGGKISACGVFGGVTCSHRQLTPASLLELVSVAGQYSECSLIGVDGAEVLNGQNACGFPVFTISDGSLQQWTV